MDYLLQLDPLLLLPLMLVLTLMALPHLSRKLKGKVAYITTGELNTLLTQSRPITLVDLRPGKEFAQACIEGSLNISKAELTQKIRENKSEFEGLKNQPIVLICQSDMDSIDAARFMNKAGFKNVSVLQGGLLRWKRDRLALKKQ